MSRRSASSWERPFVEVSKRVRSSSTGRERTSSVLRNCCAAFGLFGFCPFSVAAVDSTQVAANRNRFQLVKDQSNRHCLKGFLSTPVRNELHCKSARYEFGCFLCCYFGGSGFYLLSRAFIS